MMNKEAKNKVIKGIDWLLDKGYIDSPFSRMVLAQNMKKVISSACSYINLLEERIEHLELHMQQNGLSLPSESRMTPPITPNQQPEE